MFKAVILGAPASGKGTISSRIVKQFDVFHLSTGNILRGEIKNGTALGKEAEKYVNGGKLVPDALILDLLSSEMKKLTRENWLLDGFPRTRNQAAKLDEMAPINYAINLVVPFGVILDRARGRWIHAPSGRVYNDSFNSPKVPGKDDETGEPLVQREDDKPETVRKRLETYRESVKPVLQFYKEKKLLHEFYGETSDEIWPKVQKALSQHLKPRL